MGLSLIPKARDWPKQFCQSLLREARELIAFGSPGMNAWAREKTLLAAKPTIEEPGSIRNCPRRISGHSCPWGDICGHDRARPDNRPLANRHATKQCGSAANARASLHNGWHNFPVCVCLKRAIDAGRPRILIVDESYVMADEDFVFDSYAFANKCVARNFAVSSHAGALLNFDERSNPRAVTNLAAIEIYEVVNTNIAAELNVRRDYAELSRHG